MAADENRCPSCGVKLPANAPEGYSPRRLSSKALAGNTPAETVDATAEDTVPADPEAARPKSEGPATGAAKAPAESTDDGTNESGELTHTSDGSWSSQVLPRSASVLYLGDYEIEKELGRGGMGV